MLHGPYIVLQLLQIGEVLEKLLTNFSVVNVGLLLGDRKGLVLGFLVTTVDLVLLNSSVFLSLQFRLVIEVSLQVRGTLVTPWPVHDSHCAIRLSKGWQRRVISILLIDD